MPALSDKTRHKIQEYLKQSVECAISDLRGSSAQRGSVTEDSGSLEVHPSTLKPFHDAILPQSLRVAAAVERSLSTRLGATFEQCARLIASDCHAEARRQYHVNANLDSDALREIEVILRRIDEQGVGERQFKDLVDAVLRVCKNTQTEEKRIVVDLYVRKRDGTELYFEIKSPMPNKGQCLEVLQRLLHIQLARAGNAQVETYFAMPYNPFGGSRTEYRWAYAERYLPADVLLIGKEFWDMLGGAGTYEELLEVYGEVGNAMAQRLLSLLQQSNR